MQYQVDPTDQTPENGQKIFFWLFGSFESAFLSFLDALSLPGSVAICWETFSTITICNIMSIKQTKVHGQKILFWPFESFKNAFFRFLNDPL